VTTAKSVNGALHCDVIVRRWQQYTGKAARLKGSELTFEDVEARRLAGHSAGALPKYQRSHCGHGIGITVHEFPALNSANERVEIEEGMVLCVETPYYEIGRGGMMVEDMIVIRNGGNECLTRMPRELRLL